MDRIDGRIFDQRCMYLKAADAAHEPEAEIYEFEVDRWLEVRTLAERGLLTPALISEIDAL